jgi:zinc/manganese transport system substrate-binding protein
MVTISEALARRMGQLDPAGADDYREHAAAFATAVDARLADWQARLRDAPGVVLYHRDALYLLDRFGVPLLGTIEPVPGVPPSARDLQALGARLNGQAGLIVFAPHQSPRAPQRLAATLGWPVHQLPLGPPMDASGSGYLAHIDRWVEVLSSTP